MIPKHDEHHVSHGRAMVAMPCLDSTTVHLDIPSFHVDGEYFVEDDDDSRRIQLVKGYSRDHRLELKQVILELICENQARLPVHMQALSGNTNDQTAFSEVAWPANIPVA